MLEHKEILEITKIAGKVRGAVFQTDARYILEREGEEGLRKVEAAIKQTGQPISYGKEIKATGWYPLSWRVLSLLTIQKVFNWGEKEIFEMGVAAPKYSFIVKTILRYFISPEKTFTESAKYWEEHYSVGKLEAPKIDVKNKHLILRLRDFKIHPILCIYLKGYFKAVAQLVVRTKNMTIKETKCMFKGDPYHEFVIDWE
jgi:predicted hydrocarbon binding protein